MSVLLGSTGWKDWQAQQNWGAEWKNSKCYDGVQCSSNDECASKCGGDGDDYVCYELSKYCQPNKAPGSPSGIKEAGSDDKDGTESSDDKGGDGAPCFSRDT